MLEWNFLRNAAAVIPTLATVAVAAVVAVVPVEAALAVTDSVPMAHAARNMDGAAPALLTVATAAAALRALVATVVAATEDARMVRAAPSTGGAEPARLTAIRVMMRARNSQTGRLTDKPAGEIPATMRRKMTQGCNSVVSQIINQLQ